MNSSKYQPVGPRPNVPDRAIDRQVGRVADPGDAIEQERPADREVGKAERRVQRFEIGRHVRRTEIQRILQ